MQVHHCPTGSAAHPSILLFPASRYAARQARRARPRGAGGRVRNPGLLAGAVHTLEVWAARPSTGGRERNP